jgi:hypothetical protein
MHARHLCTIVWTLLLSTLASTSASARNGGLYFEIAPGYGNFMTDEVIVDTDGDNAGDVGQSSFSPGLKFGLNLFGWAGAEANFAGHFWGIGSDPGGGGYLGGVFRVTPLEALTFVVPADVQIPSLQGPVNWHNRPFELGVSVGGGYTLIGQDVAYQGSYFQWGFDLKYFITPNFALGIDLPFRHTMYTPFRYENYEDAIGNCTDGGTIKGPLITADAAVEACKNSRAPEALFFAPALTITGNFDFGI